MKQVYLSRSRVAIEDSIKIVHEFIKNQQKIFIEINTVFQIVVLRRLVRCSHRMYVYDQNNVNKEVGACNNIRCEPVLRAGSNLVIIKTCIASTMEMRI